MVEGIRTGAAAQDGDGTVSVDELHQYASKKVQAAAPAMTPKIIVLKELGYKIKLTKAPIGDPKLKYRKEVERRIDQGKFSIPARRLLKRLRDELGLSSDEADAIEAEVLQPYREHQRKLKEYEDTLVDTKSALYTPFFSLGRLISPPPPLPPSPTLEKFGGY